MKSASFPWRQNSVWKCACVHVCVDLVHIYICTCIHTHTREAQKQTPQGFSVTTNGGSAQRIHTRRQGMSECLLSSALRLPVSYIKASFKLFP